MGTPTTTGVEAVAAEAGDADGQLTAGALVRQLSVERERAAVEKAERARRLSDAAKAKAKAEEEALQALREEVEATVAANALARDAGKAVVVVGVSAADGDADAPSSLAREAADVAQRTLSISIAGANASAGSTYDNCRQPSRSGLKGGGGGGPRVGSAGANGREGGSGVASPRAASASASSQRVRFSPTVARSSDADGNDGEVNAYVASPLMGDNSSTAQLATLLPNAAAGPTTPQSSSSDGNPNSRANSAGAARRGQVDSSADITSLPPRAPLQPRPGSSSLRHPTSQPPQHQQQQKQRLSVDSNSSANYFPDLPQSVADGAARPQYKDYGDPIVITDSMLVSPAEEGLLERRPSRGDGRGRDGANAPINVSGRDLPPLQMLEHDLTYEQKIAAELARLREDRRRREEAEDEIDF